MRNWSWCFILCICFFADSVMADEHVITAAVPESFPPHYSLDEFGNPVGFAIDIMQAVADKADIQVRYQVYPGWTEVKHALKNKKVDIIPNLGITEERKQWANFTHTVETFPVVMLARKSSIYATPKELSGKVVAAVKFNVGEKVLAKNPDYQKKIFESNRDAFVSLLSGEVEGWVYPQPIAVGLARQAGLEERVKVVGKPLKEIFRAVAVRIDRPELLDKLNHSIQDYIDSPQYEQIYEKWFGAPAPYWNTQRVIFWGVVIIGVVLVVSWSAHSYFLHRLVKSRTRELEVITDTAVQAVITIDKSGTILSVNPATVSLFRYSEAQLLGNNVTMLMPQELRGHHQSYIEHFLHTGEKKIIGSGREVYAVRSDGHRFPAWLSIGYAKLPGENHRFVGYISDISTRKQAEQDLLDAKHDAEQAAQSKARFLANMSHEIRTPMNAVLGFLDLTKRGQLSNDQREFVEIAQQSAKSLLSIINDILDVSKIESGKIHLEKHPFNLLHHIQTIIKTFESEANKKELSLSLFYQDNLPEFYFGDSNRLQQILVNLLSNAVKFTETGSIQVSVEAGKIDGFLHFMVTDTGIGMNVEQQKNIFEPFTQADVSTSRRFGGTGLGTTICKQLVELMEGQIWVESSEGNGSTFHFTVHIEKTDKLAGVNPKLSEQLASQTAQRCFNILLAEDVKENARLALLRLEQEGHQVAWCMDGEDTIAEVKNNSYDIILMDVQMPVMDGLQATRIIREYDRNIPIVALTASVLPEERQRCFDAGMQKVCEKPVDFDYLFKLMEELVPEGKGDFKKKIALNTTEQAGPDLSQLQEVCNLEKALKSWQKPLTYINALRGFIQGHGKDIQLIRELRDTTAIQECEDVIHAFKGVAGNLRLSVIYPLAMQLDDLAKEQQLDNSEALLLELEQAMGVLTEKLDGIGRFDNPDVEVRPENLDYELCLELLAELYSILELDNPDPAEIVLTQLEENIGKRDLEEIRKQIDAFEFRRAQEEVSKLMHLLNMKMEKV